jgi:SH3 domain protein
VTITGERIAQMKIFKYIMVVILGLCLTGQLCWADKRYVTDSFKITLRTGPSVQNKIVIMLESGEPLEVIETKNDWSHVKVLRRQGESSEGWVMSRYLIAREPWQVQTGNLGQKNVQLKERLARIEKEWRETGSRGKEAADGLKQTSYKLNVLQRKYDELKSGSANYVQLKEDYDSTTASLKSSQNNVESLKSENEILKASQKNKWLGIGALILLCGLLIGISMGRLQKKQKQNILY